MLREGRLGRPAAASALRALADLDVNYTPAPHSVPSWRSGWCLDELRCVVAREAPGDPVPGGAWEIARRLVRDYQFPNPRILRALYARDEELSGRDMLLEGRFLGLRFDMGVRVTSVVDETRRCGAAARRVWGWGYRTLQGHLEEGELVYEVVKHLQSGAVEFRISGYSRRAPIANPLVRIGFHAFGRATQHRFYRSSAHRLHRLVQAELNGAPPVREETVAGAEGLVVAPSLPPGPVSGVPSAPVSGLGRRRRRWRARRG